jgi:hypothetical protein
VHVAKFSMEARKKDLKHSVSDSLAETSKLESIQDAVEKTDRISENNDILMGRSSLLRLGQMVGGESWDPLMEGGRRDLPELSVTEDQVDGIIKGKWTGEKNDTKTINFLHEVVLHSGVQNQWPSPFSLFKNIHSYLYIYYLFISESCLSCVLSTVIARKVRIYCLLCNCCVHS